MKARRRMWKIKGYSNLATSLPRLVPKEPDRSIHFLDEIGEEEETAVSTCVVLVKNKGISVHI